MGGWAKSFIFLVKEMQLIWLHFTFMQSLYFLSRVDKDRSGAISDTELQQALSNGTVHFFSICNHTSLQLSFQHVFDLCLSLM